MSALENTTAMPLTPAKRLNLADYKPVVQIFSINNLSLSWESVFLPKDNPKNVDRKAHFRYPFNRKILIIDSFQSQNSRQELEINSPYDKVCEQ